MIGSERTPGVVVAAESGPADEADRWLAGLLSGSGAATHRGIETLRVFAAKVYDFTRQAVEQGARLVVFPEDCDLRADGDDGARRWRSRPD